MSRLGEHLGATARTALAVLAALGVATAIPGLAAADPSPIPRALQLTRALGICETPQWTADGDQLDGRFGTVAPAGDVNGDGYDDVLIGAYNYDHPETDEGVVSLYLGSPTGLSSQRSGLLECNQAGAHFGDKLSTAGDVNGDGYDDVVVGAGLYDNGQTDEGAAFLYLGSAAGLGTQPVWMTEGDQAGAQYGACVQAAGDVNADGYDDVIVGSWLYNSDGLFDQGRAFVYLGSSAGLASTPAWIGQSGSEGAVYGYFCAGAGDVNGDGYDDIVVGARRFSGNGLSSEGRVYVYHGSPTGPSVAPSWFHDGGQAGGELGAYCIAAGDVNQDGYGDVIVGAFRYDQPTTNEGTAYLFLGSAAGLAGTPSWSGEGNQYNAYYGYHVDGAGDVDGDGFDDVILSASGYDANELGDCGRAYVYLGSAGGLAAAPAWVQDGDQAGAGIDAVRGVGDVNGDGFADVMSGSLYRDNALADAGRAYLFYGCSPGRTGVPHSDGAGPRLQAAGPNPFFRTIAITFSLPAPGRVRLIIQDLAGRIVAELVHGTLPAGSHRVTWDGSSGRRGGVPAGIYWARLEAGGHVRSLELVRLP